MAPSFMEKRLGKKEPPLVKFASIGKDMDVAFSPMSADNLKPTRLKMLPKMKMEILQPLQEKARAKMESNPWAKASVKIHVAD